MIDFQTIVLGVVILTLTKANLDIIDKNYKLSKNKKIILTISGIALIVIPILKFFVDMALKVM